MWFDMRKEDLGFVERAPVVHVSQGTVAAPRARVFATFVDPLSWPHWFPNVRSVSYAGAPPYGVGTIRQAFVGATSWIEEIVVWEKDMRWAWTVTRASVPFAKAQVEAFEFSDAGDATCVRWTLALEPRLLARLGTAFAPRVISRLFGRAMQNLSAYVQRTVVPPPARS
jgi:uncharacterized protein YndB with AHSA1/START domain